MRPNNFFYVKCANDGKFFRSWIEFLTPYHHMTEREKDVAARILHQYFKFAENVEDPDVRKDLLWSRSSRKDMMASLGMNQPNFQMTLLKLRNAGFLIDREIQPKYIPHVVFQDNKLLLQVMFDWTSEEHTANNEEQN